MIELIVSLLHNLEFLLGQLYTTLSKKLISLQIHSPYFPLEKNVIR